MPITTASFNLFKKLRGDHYLLITIIRDHVRYLLKKKKETSQHLAEGFNNEFLNFSHYDLKHDFEVTNDLLTTLFLQQKELQDALRIFEREIEAHSALYQFLTPKTFQHETLLKALDSEMAVSDTGLKRLNQLVSHILKKKALNMLTYIVI